MEIKSKTKDCLNYNSMKITICGSMAFAKEMLEYKDKLEKMGHTVITPSATEECIINPELNMDLEFCIKRDLQKEHFNFISQSDAILVLNHNKNGIKGYVGGATLMEMAIASHLDKKIFLLDPIPEIKDLRYSFEIQLTKPIVLNGNLNLIS